MRPFKGLTWDHPRGHAALERASEEGGGIIAWDRQPLEGFESAPIAEVCEGYDLVVLDHPHLGDAIAANCLTPLDDVFPAETLADIRARTLGPCYQSYVFDEKLWALPLDAAAQVSAGRPDLLTAGWPSTVAEVEEVARLEPGFVMSLAGPHAFLSMLSLAATFHADFAPVEEGYFKPHHEIAIRLFAQLLRHSDKRGFSLNPIGILEEIAAGGLTYCPLIFGYVPYAAGTPPVRFANAPVFSAHMPPRGVLGGTGVALTATARPDDDLRRHLLALLSPEMQTGLIPLTSGQPSARQAWNDLQVNAAAGDFYASTIDTLEHAFLRPRHAGYCPTQTRASAWLRENAAAATAMDIRAEINAILRGR